MTVSLEDILRELPEDRRRRIEEMTAKLIAEELNLRELRRLRKLTQARLSKKLKIGQEGVSRIEKRSDLYLSTLREFVEGVGGKALPDSGVSRSSAGNSRRIRRKRTRSKRGKGA